MKFKSINLKYIQLFPSAPHFSSCTFIFSSFLHFFPFSFFLLKLSFPFPFFPVLVCSTRVSACYHYVPGLVFARLSYWRSSGHFYHQWKKRYWKKTFNLSTLFLHFHIFFPIGFFSPLSSAVCFFYVSFYAPPLSVKSNGLLCWYDISGLCVSMMLLSIHIMLLCPLSFPVHSAFGLGFFPNRPASLLLNLRPLYLQYYLNCACFIQFSCAFFSSCFLLSIKAHIVLNVILHFRYVWQGARIYISCTRLLCIANEVMGGKITYQSMCFLYLGICEAFVRLLLFFAFIYHSWHTLLYALQFKICFPVTAGGTFVCAFVCCGVSRCLTVFPTWYLKSSNTVSITLTLFQFSCRYHIIPCPGNKTPNTQATEVIQLQIEMELSVDLLKVFDVFLKPQWTACFYILFFLDVEVL